MQGFRLSHAGLVLEHGGASLFIDPGNFSTQAELSQALEAAAPPAGIVITHEHADHWTPEHVRAILALSPEAKIYTTAATAAALETAGIESTVVVTEGDRHSVGPFSLEFYGRRHEVLHSSIPVIENIGVRINETLAWGGDSITRPPFRADVLGVPIGSPWSNIAQVMDFVLATAPRRAFLTHDGMLSARGVELYTERVLTCLAQCGGELLTFPTLEEDQGARLSLG